jgi:hypothetical protein
MTSLIGARKRAEEFAAALEGELAWTDVHPELADLAVLVDDLRAQDPVEPSPEFTATLRERLMAEGEQLQAKDRVLTLPERRHGRRERRFAAAAAALVFVGGTAGMAAAAQRALPGDALYPIKRGIEQAQAGLATSDGAKGRDLLGQADTRLTEIRAIVGGSSSQAQLPPTIDAFTAQSASGAQLLMQSYQQGNDHQAIKDLRTFTTRNLSALQDLARTAPPAQQDELTQAATTLLDIDAAAVKACPSCAPGLQPLQMPKLFAVSADVHRALGRAANRPAALNNDHPALPGEDQLPSAPTKQQPSTGSGGSGTGDTQPSLPGLPTGDGSGSGGSTGGTGGGSDHPLRDLVKNVTGDGSSGGTTTKDNQDPGGLIDSLLP